MYKLGQRRHVRSHVAARSAEATRKGLISSLPVRGLCMWPALWPGDRLVIARGAASTPPSAGDLVVCLAGRRLIVHRVACCADGAQGLLLSCRGDRRDMMDAPVWARDVVGIVTAVQAASVWGRALALLRELRSHLSSLKHPTPGCDGLRPPSRRRPNRSPVDDDLETAASRSRITYQGTV